MNGPLIGTDGLESSMNRVKSVQETKDASIVDAINALGDKIIGGDVAVEKARAVSEETRLETKIDQNTDNLTTESTRATTAETALGDRIDVIEEKLTPKYEHYAFLFDNAEADPDSKITYPADCDNAAYTPAKMNFGGLFSYGSWANAFFIKNLKVVMMNFDGSIAYEIDKNDYTKKIDGTAVGEEGNVMVLIPKTYVKYEDLGNELYKIHISNYPIDSEYECFAHHGIDGTEKDYYAESAYTCWKDEEGRGRSLTGKTSIVSINFADSIAAAEANNPAGTPTRWTLSNHSISNLHILFAFLLGKSTNSQAVFGNGRITGNSQINTGSCDQKGLFWGSDSETEGMKFMGIENAWGNIWIWELGYFLSNGQELIKSTYGTEDGSSVVGYNQTGDGYIKTDNNYAFNEAAGGNGFQKDFLVTKHGLLPNCKTIGQGSATTFICDNLWWNKTDLRVSIYHGCAWGGAWVGVSCRALNTAPSRTGVPIGFSLSRV